MEKLIYVLWRDPRSEAADFHRRLREEVAPQMLELGARGLVLNIADDAARGAAPEFHACVPAMEAFVSVWLDSACRAVRRPFDAVLGSLGGRVASYVVSESQALLNSRFPTPLGERTPGFVQIAMFRRPPRVAREAWLEIWLESHTQVAMGAQDTFLYTQNVVGRALGFDSPRYDAIVEEGYPPAAHGDLRAFFDAPGDADKCLRNQALIGESCARFIDFDKLDVVQTSQYVLKSAGG